MTLERHFGARGRALLPGRARGARRRGPRRRRAGALRGRGRARAQGRHRRPGWSSSATAWSIGAGVMPDVMLASAAGLELGESGGVRAARRPRELGARASSPPATSASTTAPVHGGAGCGSSTGTWPFNHGKTAALNMLGRDVEHDGGARTSSPTSPTGRRWSTSGPGSGEQVVRGSLEDGEFTVFYLTRGGPRGAALTVGRSRRPRARPPLHHRANEAGRGRAGRRGHGPQLALAGRSYWGAGTRTPITSSRGWRLAIRRLPNQSEG